MKGRKGFIVLGIVLCLFAAAFFAFALSHPEHSFPWPNWVSYTIYGLYAAFTILVFFMPRFKEASPVTCGIVAADFIAFALLAIYIGSRDTPHESVWYLTIALGLVCAANFANIFMQKRRGKQK